MNTKSVDTPVTDSTTSANRYHTLPFHPLSTNIPESRSCDAMNDKILDLAFSGNSLAKIEMKIEKYSQVEKAHDHSPSLFR